MIRLIQYAWGGLYKTLPFPCIIDILFIPSFDLKKKKTPIPTNISNNYICGSYYSHRKSHLCGLDLSTSVFSDQSWTLLEVYMNMLTGVLETRLLRSFTNYFHISLQMYESDIVRYQIPDQ